MARLITEEPDSVSPRAPRPATATLRDLQRCLDAMLDLRQNLEEQLKAIQMASAPLARNYHRAHTDCLEAVGNYNSTREKCDLLQNGIPRPFPFDLYLTRDAASRSFLPYKNEMRRLNRGLEDTEKEIKSLKRLIARESKQQQGDLDL